MPSDDPKRRQPNIAKAKKVLGWEPRTPLRDGMAATYKWIAGEYAARKAGKTVAVG